MKSGPATASFRRTLQFYLIDCNTALGKFIDVFIIVLNLAICVLLIVETYPIGAAHADALWNIEIGLVAVLIVEYTVRIYASPNRLQVMRPGHLSGYTMGIEQP